VEEELKIWGEAGMGLKLLVVATSRGENGLALGAGSGESQAEGVSKVALIWLDWRAGAKLSEATREAPMMRPRPGASEGRAEKASRSFCQKDGEVASVPASILAMILEEKELK
jgi:hypothetical protein